MGKYERLTDYLGRQPKDKTYVEMTFKEIEKIIGEKLPPSANVHRAWWSNNEQNSAMTRAWRLAHFRSTRVDMTAGKLTFVREHPPRLDQADQVRAEKRYARKMRHPLIGAMRGTVWIAPGTDLTQPADPDWGDVAYGDKTWDDVK
jgi:hypothetical protein